MERLTPEETPVSEAKPAATGPARDMRVRAFALAVAFALAGTAYQISGASKGPERTEAWMQETAISSFGRYQTQADPDLPGNVTYKMDKSTYQELDPYGIVARVMDDGAHKYDVTLIASATKASFHDPRVCFTAQGWELNEELEVPIETKARGTVTATLTRLKGKDGERWGAFFYRGPDGFCSSTNGLKVQLFKSQLFKGQNAEGVFYRFIAMQPGSTKEELVTFIKDYLDASDGPTKGYF